MHAFAPVPVRSLAEAGVLIRHVAAVQVELYTVDMLRKIVLKAAGQKTDDVLKNEQNAVVAPLPCLMCSFRLRVVL